MKRQRRIVTATVLLTLLIAAPAFCQDDQLLKLDQVHDQAINDPYRWAIEQFSDGPVSSEYGQMVLKYDLKQAIADFGMGKQILLLRQDIPARVWEVLVFSRAGAAFQYLGHFPAGEVVISDGLNSIMVYEACGGHCGFIKVYVHNGKKCVCQSSQEISVGDCAPDENNKKRAELFSDDKIVKWTKVPDQAL